MKQIIKKPFLSYTILFVIFVVLMSIPLFIKGGLFIDAISQHLLFMNDYIDAIKNLLNGQGFQLFRFDIGMGADVIISYTYYSLFDPINIIALILPKSMIEASYYIILLVRIYLSGIFIILLAKKLNIKNPISLVCIAIFYCFNACCIYSALRHPMFINVLMLLPLACIGFEQVIKNKAPYLIIFCACYGLISQFYCFAYLTLGFELYILLRIIIEKKNIKDILKHFFKINLFYFIGIILASFVLLPQFITLFDSSRTASKGFILYNSQYYLGLISSFVIPLVSTHYTATFGNFIVFLIVLGYLINNRKKQFSIYIFITIIFLSLSIFGYIFNICSYVNNRWSFIMLLPTALIVGEVLDNNELIAPSSYNLIAKVINALVLLCAVLALNLLASLIRIKLVTSCISIILIITYIYFTYKIFKSKTPEWQIKTITWLLYSKRIVYIILILSFVSALAITIFSVTSFYTYESFDIYDESELTEAFKDDNDFYRIEQSSYSLGRTSLANDGIYYHYPSTTFYNTMATATISEMLDYFDIPNFNYGTGYNGFDSRIITNALSSTKYLLISASEFKTVPYGFTYFKTIKTPKIFDIEYDVGGKIPHKGDKIEYEDTKIYQNQNFIKFGYMYHNYYTLDQLEQLNGLQKEYLTLNGIILEKDISGLNKLDISDFNIKEEKKIVEDEYFINNTELSYDVNHQAGNIYISCDGLVSEEKYILTFEVYKNDILLSKTQEKYYPYGSNFYYESDDITNLGYFNDGNYTVKIKSSSKLVELEEITIYEDDLTKTNELTNKLNQETLENIKFNSNGFTAEIDAKEGMLLVSLPYGKGFKAYVDNEEVEIYQANIGYMGIMIKDGFHNIKFVYNTKGLKEGCIISSITFFGLLISVPLIIIKTKRKKMV